jgi:hypothetical protein
VSYGWRREDGVTAEVCDECGFDSRRVHDLAGALRSVLAVIGDLHGDPEAGRQPAPGTWSGAEYSAHALHVVAECIGETREAAGLEAVPEPADAAGAIAAVGALFGELTDRRLDGITLEVPFGTLSARGNLLHGLHDAEHHVLDIRRGYAGFALARGDDLHTTRR